MKNTISQYFIICALFTLAAIPGQAHQIAIDLTTDLFQDTSSTNESVADSVQLKDPFESGGFEEAPKPLLLPQNISFSEKFLWGENGFVRKIGLTDPLTTDVRKKELELRRTMLSTHQITGFTTVALMLTACYYGQRTIDANGKGNSGEIHSAVIGGTILMYSITAALSLLSPPPLVRRDEGSTTTWHKVLAWGHVLGMIVTPFLADKIQERESPRNQKFDAKNAHIHQVSGYITTALFTSAMLVITL